MMNTESDRLLAAPPGSSRWAILGVHLANPDRPPSRPAHCPTTRATTSPAIAAVRLPTPPPPLHDLPVGHSGHGSARTPDASPWQRTADTPPGRSDATPDTGQQSRGQARADTGCSLRTPDAGRGRGHGDEGTAGLRTSWAAAPNGGALDTQPYPSGQRPQRVAPMTAQRWATSARDCRSQYQAPARPPRRPSRASAHCCPQMTSGRE